MPADLSGPRLKVARAKKQLDTLRGEISVYLKSGSYHIVEEKRGNKQTVRSFVTREPDPEWGLDVAQIAGHARSCLDLLVRQLIIDSGNNPDASRRSQFPIFRIRDDYVSKGRSGQSHRDVMLKGVAPRHRKIIDDLQPYQRGRRIEDDPLCILDAITNRDKHRELHASLGAIARERYRLIRPDGRYLTVTKEGKNRPQRIMDNEILFGIANTPPPGSPQIEMKLAVEEIEVSVFFDGDRVVSLDDMERSVLYVSGIIERFARRISP